jgi:hypothetical protein
MGNIEHGLQSLAGEVQVSELEIIRVVLLIIQFYPMGTGGSSLGVKRPGREADHSHPSSAEVEE